jgi:hypothetical protein
MKQSRAKNQSSLTTYPLQRIIAVIDNDAYARNVLEELLKSNSAKENDIEIFFDHGSIQKLEAHTKNSSMMKNINEKLHSYGIFIHAAMKHYKTALQKGKYVFNIKVGSDEEKRMIHHVLFNHNAYLINYFSLTGVEALPEA